MINILAISLDYLMLQGKLIRGDVVGRQFMYANYLDSFNLIIYSPRKLGFKREVWGENIIIYPTSSRSKLFFIYDALKIAYKVCRKKNIDVITTQDPFVAGLIGYILKRKFNIPLNIQIHTDFIKNKYWISDVLQNLFFYNLGKFIVKGADSIRETTHYQKEKVKKLKIPDHKIKIIPVNCNLSKFENADGTDIRKSYLEKGYKTILFSAARIVRHKDFPTMIKAMGIVVKKYPDVILLIAGDGNQFAHIKKLIGEMGLENNIEMVGPVSHNIIPKYFAASDIYLLSSLFEGGCIALAEAAGASKAIISTKVAGFYEFVVEGKTGLGFGQRDYKEMARKILLLIENKELRVNMGKEAKNHVSNFFSEEHNIKGLIKLWEDTAARRVL